MTLNTLRDELGLALEFSAFVVIGVMIRGSKRSLQDFVLAEINAESRKLHDILEEELALFFKNDRTLGPRRVV